MSFVQNKINQAINEFSAGEYQHIQYASVAEMERIQNHLLMNHIHYVAQNSPHYQKVFKERQIDVKQIQSVGDLTLLPLTEKDDLIAHNDAFRSVAESEIVDVCLTSASSGAVATRLCQTISDLTRLAYNEEVALAMSGITEQDTLLICAALDRAFMAGLAYFLGGVKLNARMIRGGAGSAAQHWELIQSTGVTAIVGVPSLMKKIADYATEKGHDPKKTAVTKLIAIGEPTRNEHLELLSLPEKLEEIWDAQIYSTYASTELATTFCECEARQGGHLRPELMAVEIVDEQGRSLLPGQKGEVVVTPLGVTGMPLIRFRTGDISYLINTPCKCGRTTPRLAPILGRKHQMLKYKGTTIFPNAIIAALEGIPHFHGGYVEVHKTADGLDRVILFANWDNRNWPQKKMEEELRAKVRVVPEIQLISADQINEKVYQFSKKRKRATFFDLR